MSGLQVASLVVILGGLASAGLSFGRIFRIIKMGKPKNRFGDFGRRLVFFTRQVFGHEKLLRQPIPGIIHFLIFWGFVLLTFGTFEWFFHGFSGGLHFDYFLSEPTYGVFCVIQDVTNAFVAFAVAGALYRRLVVKPKRMADNSKKSSGDAYFILSMILGLVVTNLLTHAIGIYNGSDSFASFKPVASWIANTFFSGGPFSETTQSVFWWAHLAIIIGFANYLPYSKHLHVVAAAPNTWFSKMEPRGRLTPLDLSDEKVTTFGAQVTTDLSWKAALDSYACTECGRCNEFCPTTNTGKPLRPKTLMIDLRAAITKNGLDKEAAAQNELVPAVFSDEFVWGCTTCGACVESCPVLIDHVDHIVEMRRALVLNKGSNPEEATNAFRNWETNSNPWGLPDSSRQDWLLEKGIPRFDPDQHEYLYYLGCAGSFDDRAKKVVEATCKVLNAAGLKFGVLGKDEKCNGETARRLGNEYLAQQMIQANKDVLEQNRVKKIITTCPHCFNTLKNEYPDFGGHYEVHHHSEFIQGLLASGRVPVKTKSAEGVTFHDSCYIGRYNQIYDAPRSVIEAVSQAKPIEMERSKEKGFCCGAGGGRMWLEEKTGTRINHNRAEEVLGTKASTVAVSCPFCMTMLSDGLKAKGREDVKVKDLAELVAESL